MMQNETKVEGLSPTLTNKSRKCWNYESHLYKHV